MTKGLEKELELTEVQKVQLRIAEASAQGFSEALRAGLLGAAAQLDAIKSINEAQEERIRIGRNLAIESGSAVNDSNGARQAQLTSLLAATDSAKLEATRADMMLLTEEYQRFIDTVGAAGISEKQYFEAVNERLGLNAEELKKSKSLAEELGLSFTSAFEDAIVGGSKFSDLLKGLERDIIAIVTRQYVTKPLTTALDGLFKSDGGGGIGGLFSSIFGSIFGGPTADGGPVSGGTPYLVGERGPEMFVPRGSGTIVPNARMGRSMVIHINPPAGMSRQSSSQFAADVARQLRLADARNG